jgi:3-hydroxyisobutyrate dehydrogenase-like beta-hydroxyacid dehydrogenase
MKQKIGMIGLGIMGSAMSGNLLKGGFDVLGYDVLPERVKELEDKKGIGAASCKDVAQQVDVAISSLPSNEALHDIVFGRGGLLKSARKGFVLIETSTLTLEAKEEAYKALRSAGADMLDCPLSGTGAQALRKDLAVYASGKRETAERCQPVFEGFARAVYYVGEFGMGMKMKFVNNLLVTIHNVCAAEAMVLGMKAGLDPQMIYTAVTDGSGSSRMFEVRGPLMVAGKYDKVMMKVDLHQKDIKLIAEFANSLHCPTPLLSAAAQLYTAAIAHGWSKLDTASVCAVLEEMAGVKRSSKS